MKKRCLGVIGGLGPLATAYFFELAVRMTQAGTDQEHMEIIVFNRPSVPDRTGYILGRTKESSLPAMMEMGLRLREQGAEYLAVPCITAHYFYRELVEAVGVPVLHMVRETVEHLACYGIKRAGIMATDGTIYSELFQKELDKRGIGWITPDKENQRYVTDLIYQDIKAGKPLEMDKFVRVSGYLKKKGAECIILGCTELSLVKREYGIGAGYLDAMEVLARQAVLAGGAQLKGEYQCLITG